jgi:DHA1 family bicyclomycin/chloramphenicol resistance-like MFS transporter
MATVSTAPPPNAAPIGFAEFVALVASMLAMGALGIDAMLPALPAIGEALGVADPNQRQFVIGAFLAGFGLAQLIHGPLSDRYGRRNLLAVALGGYALTNVAAALSGSFELLIAARVAGGIMISATRVATVALVRDCYSGRAMARVMSMAFMTFMLVPILAPALGQVVLLVGGWRDIFWTIATLAGTVMVWLISRMPETLARDRRIPLSVGRIVDGWRRTVGDRWSLGYTLAGMMLLGGLYGYLNSIQQIMADVFAAPHLLVLVFAGSAATMAVANLLNARFVVRVGTRRISHGAVSVLIAVTLAHLALVLLGWETLASFTVLQAATMACFGLATSNFSAMAMENMGAIAGTASSVQGFTTVTGGALLGSLIGQAFDGSAAPMVAGFALAGVAALGIVLLTERGRLFGAH